MRTDFKRDESKPYLYTFCRHVIYKVTRGDEDGQDNDINDDSDCDDKTSFKIGLIF